MQCTDRIELNNQIEPFMKGSNPAMELIVQEPQVSSLRRQHPKQLHAYLYLQFKQLNDSLKIAPEYKLSNDEIIELADDLIKEYWHYRVMDFAIFVKNAKKGAYGKSYNRLDIPTIFEWIKKYDRKRDKLLIEKATKYKQKDNYQRSSQVEKISENQEFRKVLNEYHKNKTNAQ